MGGYIKLDKDTEADPRLLELADRLMGYLDVTLAEGAQDDIEESDDESLLTGFSGADARALLCNAMLGGLVRLWTYADVRIRNDDTLPLSRTALAQVMRLPDWVVGMFPTDWLVDRADIGGVELPGYCAKNAVVGHEERREDKEIERRKWRDDKRRQRSKRRSQNGVHRPPKKSTPVRDVSEACPPPTGTGPVPVRPVPGPRPDSAAALAAGRGAAATPRKSFEDDFRDRFSTEPRIKATDGPIGNGRKP